MGKRFAKKSELETAPVLPIRLPQSKHASDPFSRGAKPELYREPDLKKVAVEKQARTDEFEKRLLGIWWATETPVPFVFRTADGTLRSLDAGCVGFLLNRWQKDCDAVLDAEGYVVAVVPNQLMIERYYPLKAKLMAALSAT